jgi:hypothetical protein
MVVLPLLPADPSYHMQLLSFIPINQTVRNKNKNNNNSIGGVSLMDPLLAYETATRTAAAV